MHLHDIYLTPEQMRALKRNTTQIHVYTTLNNGHNHEMVLKRDPHRHDELRLIVASCDGKPTCWDKHGNTVFQKSD